MGNAESTHAAMDQTSSNNSPSLEMVLQREGDVGQFCILRLSVIPQLKKIPCVGQQKN